MHINENSYAVDGAGDGMPVTITGPGQCSSLTSSGTIDVST